MWSGKLKAVRLFVAAEIGEALAARAAAVGAELQKRAAVAAPRAKATWIPADRLHLTIRFIGEIEEARVTAIRDVLAVPIGIAPFDLTLAGAGAFPKGGAPRVLWVGVAGGHAEVVEVEREITSRLLSLGVPGEERAYNPHLTLARVREPAGLRSARLLEGLTETTVGTVRVDAITLFHSKLSPKGPAYVPLLHTPLKAAGE